VTGLVCILLAVAAGLIVSTRRQLLIVIGAPLLAILVVQTWAIGAGKGVSPPSTVTAFPGLIGYYVVQLIIFGLAFGAADQIRMRRVRGSGGPAVDEGRQTRKALVINGLLDVAVVVAFVSAHSLLDPGSVTHHKTNGSPPIAGVLGILSCALVFAVLGVMTLVSRKRGRSAAASDRVAGDLVGQTR
jgi:hypothetical protein